MKTHRKVVIEDGGDWTDASYTLLVVPIEVDLGEEKRRRDIWYREEYVPALHSGKKPRYFSFDEWLVEKCGAKPDEEYEIFNDY